MFAGGLLLGVTLLFFAGWLQWTEHHGWPHDTFNDAEDKAYRDRRKKSRLRVNMLIGICGVLILTAAIAGKGLFFIAAWTIVSLILMVIVILAGLDAFRTHRHHQDKIRRIRKKAVED